MEPKEDPPLVAMLRSLLNRNMCIKITDGRVFVGQFMCIDHSRNIILSCANEYRGDEALTAMGQSAPTAGTTSTTTAPTSMTEETKRKAEDEKRFVGLVMIPGHHIIKALADTSHLHGSKDPKIPSTMSSLSSTTTATMSSIYNADYLRGG